MSTLACGGGAPLRVREGASTSEGDRPTVAFPPPLGLKYERLCDGETLKDSKADTFETKFSLNISSSSSALFYVLAEAARIEYVDVREVIFTRELLFKSEACYF